MLVAVLVERSRFVHLVDLTLIQVHKKHDVIAEARQSVHGWHLNDESEEVVDERVQGTIDEFFPRQIRDRLVLVIDKDLRCHQDEAETVHARRYERQTIGVPPSVAVDQKRVDSISSRQGLMRWQNNTKL